MTESTDDEYASLLLHLFDAETLGGGNLDAGANVLAAMALTISNIQRPEAAVIDQSDTLMSRVGCSLAVSGGLSSRLTTDLVLAPLLECQNSVVAHVRHRDDYEKRRWEKLARTKRESDGEPEKEQPEPLLSGLARDAMLGEDEQVHRWVKLFGKPPGDGFHEICRHPLVYSSAGNPDAIEKVLPAAHLGRPYVHVALQDAADCSAYQQVASRLMNGCQLFQPEIRGIRGELVITDPANALGDAVRAGQAGTGWLHGALWLSDHAGGPSFAPWANPDAVPHLDRVIPRYILALSSALAGRLSAGKGRPERLVTEYREEQIAWVEFLRQYDPSFPGIAGSLCHLPASLFFGLFRIREARKNGKGILEVYPRLVYAFAKVLALRMINARRMMLQHGHQARIETLAESVRRKLADGPLTVRELTRRSHRLPAAECEAALECLLLRGLVKREGNAWALREIAAANTTSTQTLTLDV